MPLTCCKHDFTVVPEDPRFAYRWRTPDGPIVISFISEDGQKLERSAHNENEAYEIMLQQARPHRSLRIGDLIRSITDSVGIPSCLSCKSRQLRLNKGRY